MRIQMIYGVRGNDGTTWDPDTIHETDDAFGRWLLARKKARLAPAAAARSVGPVVEESWCATEDDAPAGPEMTSEPVEESPKRRTRKGRR